MAAVKSRETVVSPIAHATRYPIIAANAIPIPWVEPVDISNAVLFLASDEARYVTGIAMPVDAGFLVK